ncbi:hypothetical protein JRO89_XS10G0003900 [Xanthoceras sorbifolium]|uniref:Glucosidase 2 subunit beta n=1 Tax=Xanthoceras sorbifolium TaxID=99658 RepID=A0ABQ8HH71_9ROSI|nr:hypothetical protein JRO89_XS10G0003900 [Xanthoceras sorbifolium]
MRVTAIRFICAVVLVSLCVSSSLVGRSAASLSPLLNDPFYGISPQDENYYRISSNTIKCKDGSKKFTKTQLNDDFCDCSDGTDEPGTSACPNGKFYCRNAGHAPLLIFSSRVNDGLCDCCDGSDEYDGEVNCPNTCWEAGKVARDKLTKKIATFKEGVHIRKQQIEQAKLSLANEEAELSKLKDEEKILKGLVEQLKERKEQIEKAEEKERLQREKEEKDKKEAEEKALKEKSDSGKEAKQENKEADNSKSEDKSTDSTDDEKIKVTEDSSSDQNMAEGYDDPAAKAEHSDASDNVQTPSNEHAAEKVDQSVSPKSEDNSAVVSEVGHDAGNEVSPDEVTKVETDASESTKELSKEELGRLVASRWTGENTEKQGEDGSQDSDHETHEEMPEDTYDEEDGRYSSDTDEDLEDTRKYDDTEKYDDTGKYDGTGKYDDNDIEDDMDDTYKEEDHSYKSDIDDEVDLSETTNPSWLKKIQQTVRNILQAVNLFQTPIDKSEAAHVRKEYEESSAKLSKIQSRISSLTKKLKHDFGPEKEFYSVYGQCFETKENKYVYKICPYKQATQEEGHSTTRLGSWEKFEDSYRLMIFSDGDKCWNGPDRSLKVKLRCGLKNEVADIDEPSRCEYVALLSTPALCLEQRLQELQQKLDSMNKEQPQRHDEL